jgi:hypothetical protein
MRKVVIQTPNKVQPKTAGLYTKRMEASKSFPFKAGFPSLPNSPGC